MAIGDFKQHLYSQLKAAGVMSSLKVHTVVVLTFYATRSDYNISDASSSSQHNYCYLQTQLRSQVLTKLQKQECSIHAAVPSSEALWRNVMNSLIVDYLSACHYHYTLSVFQPEADISGLQALTHADILQFMQVSPGSPLQTALGTKYTLSTADGEPPACAHHTFFMSWAARLQPVLQHWHDTQAVLTTPLHS